MPPFHPQLWPVQSRLGKLLIDLDRAAEAEPLLRRLATEAARLRGPRHPDTALAEADLALALTDQRHFEESERWLKQALQNLAQALGAQSEPVSRLRRQLADAYVEWGRFREAAVTFRADLQAVQARLGPRHPEVAGGQTSLALALALRQKGMGPDAGQTVIVETVLSRILTAMGQPQAGRERAEHAVAVFDRSGDLRETPYMARARLRLAEALRALGQPAQAAEQAAIALRLFERAYGPRHEDTVEARKLVGSLGSAR